MALESGPQSRRSRRTVRPENVPGALVTRFGLLKAEKMKETKE